MDCRGITGAAELRSVACKQANSAPPSAAKQPGVVLNPKPQTLNQGLPRRAKRMTLLNRFTHFGGYAESRGSQQIHGPRTSMTIRPKVLGRGTDNDKCAGTVTAHWDKCAAHSSRCTASYLQ